MIDRYKNLIFDKDDLSAFELDSVCSFSKHFLVATALLNLRRWFGFSAIPTSVASSSSKSSDICIMSSRSSYPLSMNSWKYSVSYCSQAIPEQPLYVLSSYFCKNLSKTKETRSYLCMQSVLVHDQLEE